MLDYFQSLTTLERAQVGVRGTFHGYFFNMALETIPLTNRLQASWTFDLVLPSINKSAPTRQEENFVLFLSDIEENKITLETKK